MGVRDPEKYRRLGIESSAAKLRALKLCAMGPAPDEVAEQRALWRRAGDQELERLALVDDPSPHTEARARLEALGCYQRAGEEARAIEQERILQEKGLPR